MSLWNFYSREKKSPPKSLPSYLQHRVVEHMDIRDNICINRCFFYTYRDFKSQKMFLSYSRSKILLSMVVWQQGALSLGRKQRLVDVGDHLSRDI